ncbi:heavy-metal-associated domain-containing protein [Arthrobacter glacialis]|uniref:HMA domain-containing protein n=1 Tax=Arthrobacter glacialis TaxID=1664 RepID=A0A2S3ZTJ3_ARTGL|nr:heavy-metal-associated domain-containing protein [Arthrobacter glacialis]POH72493.1 hypothetical protein CVS27_15325 [Arthrobacter glacialis]
MCEPDSHTLIELTPVSESTCACCSTETKTAAPASAKDASGTSYRLEGLTCGHCVQRVESAIMAVAGVDSATIDLVVGGASTLTVSGSVTSEEIRAAVAVAGYAVITS